MTVTEQINIAIVSQYKWAVSIIKSGLFGGGTPDYLPQLLLSVRKNVEWKYAQEGIVDAISATSRITVDSLGGVGTVYHFTFADADLGTITLADYTEQVTDTDTTILATSITTALSNNLYGYDFTSSGNIVTCIAPARLGANANGIAINPNIIYPSLVLSNVASPDVNAAPSSADSIMYILEVDNQTPSTQTITNINAYVRGTHSTGDFFSIDVYENTTPVLAGATYQNSVAPIDSNSVAYDIAIGSNILSGLTKYYLLILSVNATPTAGRTGFLNGAVDPLILTITGTPPQINQQLHLSGVVTIT